MKITLSEDRTVKWPVKVNVPQDGGTVRVQTFTGHFRLARADAVKQALNDRADDFDQMIVERLIGWEGDLRDETDAPIPFSDDARDALCGIPYVRPAVIKAYFEAANGGRAKN